MLQTGIFVWMQGTFLIASHYQNVETEGHALLLDEACRTSGTEAIIPEIGSKYLTIPGTFQLNTNLGYKVVVYTDVCNCIDNKAVLTL